MCGFLLRQLAIYTYVVLSRRVQSAHEIGDDCAAVLLLYLVQEVCMHCNYEADEAKNWSYVREANPARLWSIGLARHLIQGFVAVADRLQRGSSEPFFAVFRA